MPWELGARKMSWNWQPIETAPKDGTAFLAFVPYCIGYVARQDIQVLHWSGWGGGVWDDNNGFHTANLPTHWMPLPDGPSVQP